MRRSQLVIVCVLLGTLTWGLSHTLPSRRDKQLPSADQVKIEPRVARQEVFEDVGNLKYRFEICNHSSEIVHVRKVVPDCSCTVGKLDGETIDPGRSVALEVEYNATSKFGELPPRTIIVHTDSPGCEQLTCRVEGVRHQYFQVDPPGVDFGSVVQGTDKAHDVVIVSLHPNVKLCPERAITNHPALHASVVDNGLDDKGLQRICLKIGLASEAQLGRIHGSIFIPREQDDGFGPQVTVTAELVGQIRLLPSTAFLGLVDSSSSTERSLRIESTLSDQNTSIEIISTHCPDWVRIRVEPDQQSVVVGADVARIPADAITNGGFSARVAVKCRYQDKPVEIAFDVIGRLRQGKKGD